jgi:molybdate transport system ATP-binding protein
MTIEIDVRHRLGSFELHVAFTAPGGITALFGRSGAGKTTVVNAVAGLTRPDEGRVRLGDAVLLDTEAGISLPPHRRRVGYVFQEGRLFPHLTVRQNLTFGRWFTARRERYGDFDHIVSLLGIESLLERRPTRLSGGEKQRVAIGRALLASPRILLMDEPLASLDEARKLEIMPYIERLCREVRIPIIYVTHAINEIARLADTVVAMDAGRSVATGPVGELLERLDLQPVTGRFEAGALLVARLVDHDPVFRLSRLMIGDQDLLMPEVDMPPGSEVRLRVRARDVALATVRPEGISIRNILRGVVAEIRPEPETAFAETLVDVGGARLRARLTRAAVADLDLAPGKAVFALIKSIAFDRRGLPQSVTTPAAGQPDVAR